MVFWKKAAAALICVVLIFGVSVSSLAVEMSLAGVRLGSTAADVLKRFGNPTRITVGTVATGGAQPAGAPGGMLGMPGMPGPAGMPPIPGAMPGSPLGPLAGLGSYPGVEGLGGLPAPPGFGLPGMPGAPGTPGEPGQTGPVEQQVTWTYDLADGTTVEFIISDTGHVIQVTVGGARAYVFSRTSKGIKLGDSYKDVILKYGYPESHSYAGRFLRASFADKHRCVFTFLGNKLVGITIALKTE